MPRLTDGALTYNQMVMNKLNLVFSALADETRRGMLTQLADGEANVSALAARYEMSQPAISKHLKVLERAGLITKTRRGRERFVRVNTKPLRKARNWISHYAKFWEQQFDAVETYLSDAASSEGGRSE